MCPGSARSNQPNSVLANTEQERNTPGRCAACQHDLNFLGIGFCEFCHSMSRPSKRNTTLLGISVQGIVQMCSQKKMSGIHARRIVAVVQDAETVGNMTIMNSPRNPMGRMVTAADPTSPIALNIPSSHPQPARIWSASAVYLRPESLNSFWGKLGMHCQGSFLIVPRPRTFPRREGLFVPELYQESI